MGKELSLQQKKDLAKAVFMTDDLSQQELAEKVGVSKPTINKWIGEGKWKDLKQMSNATEAEQLKKFISQLDELNKSIGNRPEGERFPSYTEVSIATQLTKAIKQFKGDGSLVDLIFFNKRFIDFLRKHHTDKVKEITLLLNQFVNENV